MPIMSPPLSLCPTCGRESNDATVNHDGENVATLYYLCTAGHLWSVRWAVNS